MFPICCRWCLHSHTLSITNQYHSIPFDTIRFNSFHLPLLSFLYGSHKYDRLSVRLSIHQTVYSSDHLWMNVGQYVIELAYFFGILYYSRSYWRRWLCRFYVHPTIWELLPLSGVHSFVFGLTDWLAEWLSIIDFYI